ncbi:low molecular weight protein arginine phosphatase [Staphylococcus intermedius]|uniref:Low molecular weight protein-tyrosine-phosphatase PtpB n=1 Tax=Staphylococcus intermedius NCTC 11048 TaxID=1141106 RepID=A0A380G772_STAIN|nr:low molecular weight protein arginine phosphatase [Staphylococcus intermedius]PCF62834.1 low molecular weight phosphatase family protein [Staphylococcus intermedius]PCF77946.1 low molecular weight phosphatase family protein [Staphylococcus intermedius]PCF78298.1 low molecular weight phosphatase family protein [Staphylococcus intermedius]PCF85326.1 low molecular weight phosphatase family protein [Staphylococcus intermedius]PCF86094.1 low molecular weight phosphatase family protein [Staphyloc
MKIVFVCTGNTCRSPLAESIAKQLMPDFEIVSRGLMAQEGQPISPHSRELIQRHELPNPNTAQLFDARDAEADLILTMTRSHQQMIQAVYGAEVNVYALNDYVDEDMAVEDPYGGAFESYEQVFNQLTRMIEKLKSKLVTE